MSVLTKPFMQARKNNGVLWEPDSSCVLWLPGQDDAYSSTIRDRSGKENHGTITGATRVRNSQGLWGLGFDGTDDIVNCGNGATLNSLTSNVLLEAWVNPTDAGEGNNARVFDKAQGAAEGFYIYMGAPNSIAIKIFIGGVGKMALATLTLGTYTHIMAGHDGTNVLIIVNGVLTTGQATGGAITAHTTRPLTIGNRTATDTTFNGSIYMPRVSSVAPSVALANAHIGQEHHLFGV